MYSRISILAEQNGFAVVAWDGRGNIVVNRDFPLERPKVSRGDRVYRQLLSSLADKAYREAAEFAATLERPAN